MSLKDWAVMSSSIDRVFLALVVAFVAGCGERPPMRGRAPQVGSMDRSRYQCWEGGPHIVLPDSLRGDWHGDRMGSDPLDPSRDYGRACQVGRPFGLINVGRGNALVFADPPMVAWDLRGTDDSQDFFVLLAWEDESLDDLLDKAKARGSLEETSQRWIIEGRGAGLLYAGDNSAGTVVGRVEIPVAPGTYRILKSEFDEKGAGHVVRVRLQRDAGEGASPSPGLPPR